MESLKLTVSAALQAEIEVLGLDFMARFLELAIARRPEWHDALVELGHVYTRQGRYADGLRVDQQLAKLYPEDAMVRYNLGCSLALVGSSEAALDALEQAIALGYRDGAFMAQDGDLASLLCEPRFQRLLAKLATSKP